MQTGKKAPPPIRRQHRKLIGENSKFKIYFDHIIADDQTTISEYLVVVPKRQTRDGVTGVAILPVMNHKIGLIKIYRHAVDSWSWEIPRGFVENNEDTMTSVSRELEEETGLQCPKDRIRPLGWIHADAGTLSATIQLFLGENCQRFRPFPQDEMGHSEMKFFDISEIEGMIEQSEIRDPSTLVACFKYIKAQ